MPSYNLNSINQITVNNKGSVSTPSIVEFKNPGGTILSKWFKPYTLTIPSLPTGVSYVTVKRPTASKVTYATKGNTIFNGSGTYQMFHDDPITILATATSGYSDPSISPTSITPSANQSVTITAGSRIAYSISFNAIPVGVASRYIYLNNNLLITGAAAGNFTAYYGDTVAISATAASGYNAPSISPATSFVVYGASSIVVTAGNMIGVWTTIHEHSSGTLEVCCTRDNYGGITNYNIFRSESPISQIRLTLRNASYEFKAYGGCNGNVDMYFQSALTNRESIIYSNAST